MPRGKEYPLSLVLRTVDKATAGLRHVTGQIRNLQRPLDRVNRRFRTMAKAGGLPQLGGALRGVGSAARTAGLAVGGIAVAAGLSTAAIKDMITAGDDLAKKADRIGLTVDGYAQLRFAAERSGTEMARFDSAMEGFSKRLGEAKAGTGSLTTFLNKASPALLRQLKGAKSNEEAFDLLSRAMGKVEDPAKRAALAAAAFGRSGQSLLNLFAEGPDGIQALRDEFAELAGPQEEGARSAEAMADEFANIDAAFMGVKASILQGLAPAFVDLSKEFQGFLKENRGQITEWVREFGEKLPDRIQALQDGLRRLGDAIKPVWDFIGGVSGAAKVLAGILGGKLLLAVANLGKVLLATPIGLITVGIAGLISIGYQLYEGWDQIASWLDDVWRGMKKSVTEAWEPIGSFFSGLWDGIVGVFEWAWGKIQGIIDGISGAVDLVVGAPGRIANALNPFSDDVPAIKDFDPSNPDDVAVVQNLTAALGLGGGESSRVQLDITGAPPGSRVQVDPRGGGVDYTLGYQLATP
jgi:hypothetical protein